MQTFLPTVVWRHRRENLKKCSLRGLEGREDFRFFSYPNGILPNLDGYILLAIDGEPLTKEDNHRGLFLLDATWRHADKMLAKANEIPGLVRRRIPDDFRTAYPRRQDDCAEPDKGLASVEALYISYYMLGRDTSHLLDNYHWKEEFFLKNPQLLIK